jgi:molybdate-binding protein
VPHDLVSLAGALPSTASTARTLVVAGCDPAIGLLSQELREQAEIRTLAFTRSSEKALALLRDGLVHVAGVHLAGGARGAGNVRAVRERLGRGYRLARVATWEQGLALGQNVSVKSLNSARLSRLKWIGRERGSGARRCLDELLEGRRPAGYDIMAADHNEVAQAVRIGLAEAGVCVRFTADEAGLGFVSLCTEAYDFCYRAELEEDPRLQAVLEALRSKRFRGALAELPGYDTLHAGEVSTVT